MKEGGFATLKLTIYYWIDYILISTINASGPRGIRTLDFSVSVLEVDSCQLLSKLRAERSNQAELWAPYGRKVTLVTFIPVLRRTCLIK